MHIQRLESLKTLETAAQTTINVHYMHELSSMQNDVRYTNMYCGVPMAVEVSFHRNVISCELARRGMRRGAAEVDRERGQYFLVNADQSICTAAQCAEQGL